MYTNKEIVGRHAARDDGSERYVKKRRRDVDVFFR